MDIRPEQAQSTGTDKYAIQQPGVPTVPSPTVEDPRKTSGGN